MNNLYQRLKNTEANGDLIITKADLPAGFLVTGGQYEIQVKNGVDYLQYVTFIFGSTQYSCVLAKLVSIKRDEDDESEVNVIQFKESLVPVGPTPSSSIIVPFVNQTSFTYTHNLGVSVDVTVYDLTGELLLPTVTEDTVNHDFVTLTFGSPTSGRLLIQP